MSGGVAVGQSLNSTPSGFCALLTPAGELLPTAPGCVVLLPLWRRGGFSIIIQPMLATAGSRVSEKLSSSSLSSMEIVLSSSVWEATRPWSFGKDDLSYIKEVDEVMHSP